MTERFKNELLAEYLAPEVVIVSAQTERRLRQVFVEFGSAKRDMNFGLLFAALSALHLSLQLNEHLDLPLYAPRDE